MSLPTLTGTAKLLTDPKKALTRTGNPMATVLVKFVGFRKVDGKWEEDGGVVASAIAFEDAARALVAFAKGDSVELEGRATEVTIWKDKPQIKLTVSACSAPVRQSDTQRVAA